jgi:hypothetical protein
VRMMRMMQHVGWCASLLTLISLLYSGDSNSGHGLLIDKLAEACLALDDAIGDVTPADTRHTFRNDGDRELQIAASGG